jgi:hypothetical protein
MGGSQVGSHKEDFAMNCAVEKNLPVARAELATNG